MEAGENKRKARSILVVALEFFGLVGAVHLWVILKWAVIQAIGLGGHIMVERMLPSSVVKLQT